MIRLSVSQANPKKRPIVGGSQEPASGVDVRPVPAHAGELSPAAAVWHAFLLRKATQRISGMAEAILNPSGLTLRHFGVLCAVEDEPGQSQRVLGERLRIDRTTVVALTDELEKFGLLERRRGADRRAFSLYLTSDGAARLETLKGLVEEIQSAFLAPLSPAERAMLHEMLLKLTINPIGQ